VYENVVNYVLIYITAITTTTIRRVAAVTFSAKSLHTIVEF